MDAADSITYDAHDTDDALKLEMNGPAIKVNAKLETLYDGLRQPALKRYGETTSRDDEVV